MDCIQTAFWPPGDWSASNHYGVTPDIMVCGKSMGRLPINCIVISDDIEGENGWHRSPYFGTIRFQVAALKQIEIIERDNILENVKKEGNLLLRK